MWLMWLAFRMNRADGPMEWDGAVNAWHVAGGVYRMGRREWLTEAGWRQAYSAGVRTVIDLRNTPEALRRDSDPLVANSALVGITIVSAPTEESGHPRFTAISGPYLNDPAYYADNARIFPEKLARIFRELAAASTRGNVVLHCAAGRDRSGMVAAMVQDLAGDSDQEIAEGYRRAARGINERYRTHGNAMLRKPSWHLCSRSAETRSWGLCGASTRGVICCGTASALLSWTRCWPSAEPECHDERRQPGECRQSAAFPGGRGVRGSNGGLCFCRKSGVGGGPTRTAWAARRRH